MPGMHFLGIPYCPSPVLLCPTLCSDVLAHAGKEHSAVQGLRLLALYLKACSEQGDPAKSDTSDKMHSITAAARGPARECIMHEWETVCSDVLPQVTHPATTLPHPRICLPEAFRIWCGKIRMGSVVSVVQCVAMHGSPLVRCAALGVLSSLTEATYSRLSPAQQRQVWQAIHCHSASEPGSASAAHVAALKAVGALVLLPSSRPYPGRVLLPKRPSVPPVTVCPAHEQILPASAAPMPSSCGSDAEGC